MQFAPNPLVVIASRAHPLAQRKRINFGDIVNEPFLMRESGSGTRLAIETFCPAPPYANVRMTISSNEAIKHAVAEGLRIGNRVAAFTGLFKRAGYLRAERQKIFRLKTIGIWCRCVKRMSKLPKLLWTICSMKAWPCSGKRQARDVLKLTDHLI